MSDNPNRGRGLGSLLSGGPTADDDPEFRARKEKKNQADKPQAEQQPKEQPNQPATPAPRRKRNGSLPYPGTPAVLPRIRARRIPRDKLTVTISAAVIDALGDLCDRDSTRRYDEVEAALRAHLESKGVWIEGE